MIKINNKPVYPAIITSRYGWRIHPITKKKQFHKGIDLTSGGHDHVRSVQSGFVIKQGWNKLRGNYVVIQHDGFATLYQHLDSYCTKKGEKVNAGDLLGVMGSSGASTGEHLHFELHIGQYPKTVTADPEPILKGVN